MADIQAFIQALQKNLIEPLQQLPLAQLQALDTTHNQSVIDFQNAIGQLYAPPGPFSGKASDALADLLSSYYSAENALTLYNSNSLSERVSKLIQFCHQVVHDLEPKLKDLQGTDPTAMAGTTLLTMETGATASGLNETPAVPLVQLVIVGILGTVVIAAQSWQEWKIWDAYDTMHQWEMNMSGLAAHPESSLPASPNLVQDVTVDLAAVNLSPAQRQEVADIIAQLTAAGYTVDQWEIEELVKAGYSRATIAAIITSLNDGTTNVYLKGQPNQSSIVDFFSGLVTYLTLEATSNLHFLRAAYESRKPGQSIRNVIPNYDQLPPSVQRWLLMSPNDPRYYTEFGNAVEDLVDQRLQKLPDYRLWETQYGLLINKPLPGNPRLIPDIQFRLPNGCIAVIDITSYAQINTKRKYNVNGVCYIVVAIHGLP